MRRAREEQCCVSDDEEEGQKPDSSPWLSKRVMCVSSCPSVRGDDEEEEEGTMRASCCQEKFVAAPPERSVNWFCLPPRIQSGWPVLWSMRVRTERWRAETR
jgi:hypothetical protein